MAVLVTGGAGFIGSHATVELLENDYEVVVVDNLSNSQLASIERIKEMTGKEFVFHQVDLLDYQALDDVFSQYDISAVMHFAGYKAVGQSVQMPLSYYNNNISGTLTLCEIMLKHKVEKLVFSSSATVYGQPERVPIEESFSLSATNPYGRTKLMIEEILRDLAVSNPSFRIAILRYFNPIGAHPSGKLGEDPRGVPNNLIPFITQVAIGKRQELQVFGGDYDTSDGTGVRDYIHVVDLVKGHIKALEYLDNHEGIETFNLGTGTGYSVLEILRSFNEVTGKKIPYRITDRRPGDIGVCYANPEKAKKLLGWQAEKSLKEMCRDSWNWQVLNPDGFH
ncbi:UDP-glucose 4-epimerase [Planomicrobium stackebrandtii]|uniref:UDP-glucose 4-epimerase n=1 Tax=Planomicrobium stackebrandtii TaxID=253160 RepID=A0ABU0GUZ5_9BACL|nr:UDP-glucose 4-epimerase GalE [Planomicrobium stackebrandtii]MDQ0428903.1 UDP-glucose 4-epimerase [Planomicrobium stackebrandtii]